METIKNGSRGEDVKLLQQKLGLTADGIFGPNTEKAVKDWQVKHGLTADGIVGPKTWTKLMGTEPQGSERGDIDITYDPINVHVTCGRDKIKYLVIHYTAGASSAKGRAKNSRNVFLKRSASADFCVDDGMMLQVNPDCSKYYCWAVGDGNGIYGITNRNSISIEMCSNLKPGTSASKPNHEGWYFTEATINNTIKLSKYLMQKYNIPIERVVRHYDASRKACPGIVGWNTTTLYDPISGKKLSRKNTEEKWLEFKSKLV